LAFHKLDKNHSNALDGEELRDLAYQLFTTEDLTEAQVKEMKAIDTDHNNAIDEEEFAAYVLALFSGSDLSKTQVPDQVLSLVRLTKGHVAGDRWAEARDEFRATQAFAKTDAAAEKAEKDSRTRRSRMTNADKHWADASHLPYGDGKHEHHEHHAAAHTAHATETTHPKRGRSHDVGKPHHRRGRSRSSSSDSSSSRERRKHHGGGGAGAGAGAGVDKPKCEKKWGKDGKKKWKRRKALKIGLAVAGGLVVAGLVGYFLFSNDGISKPKHK